MTLTLGDRMRIVGVDEAGRGPCIGPLFVGAFCLPEEDEPLLEELGATDSKRLRPAQREAMAAELRDLGARRGWGIAVQPLSPIRIDAAVEEKGLNRLEVEGFVEAIQAVWTDGVDHRLVLDACDVDAARFGRNVDAGLAVAGLASAETDAKHQADADHRVVGAASIVAKVERDAWVRSFTEQSGINVGSGYPSDPNMKRALPALLQGQHPHEDLRWSWATTKRGWEELHKQPVPIRTEARTTVQQRLFDPPSS